MKKLWLLLILPVYLVYYAYNKYKWRNSITFEDLSRPIQTFTRATDSRYDEELSVEIPGFMKMRLTLNCDEYEITFDYFNSSQDKSRFEGQSLFRTAGYIEIDDDEIWLPFKHRSFEGGDNQTRSDNMYVDDYGDMSWDIDDVAEELMKIYSDVDYTMVKYK